MTRTLTAVPSSLGERLLQHFRGLLHAEGPEPLAELGALPREDGHGQEGRVRGPRLADGESADRDAARHLHGGEKRVEALEGGALHRNPQHGEEGVRGHHAGQVRGATRRGNQHLDTPRVRGTHVLHGGAGGAVRGEHAALVIDSEAGQGVARVLHGLPVRLAAHQDAHEGLLLGHGSGPRFPRDRPAARGLRRARGRRLPRTELLRYEPLLDLGVESRLRPAQPLQELGRLAEGERVVHGVVHLAGPVVEGAADVRPIGVYRAAEIGAEVSAACLEVHRPLLLAVDVDVHPVVVEVPEDVGRVAGVGGRVDAHPHVRAAPAAVRALDEGAIQGEHGQGDSRQASVLLRWML